VFVEVRKAGKKKKYYLVHSFRDGKKVKKLRRYLGSNLSEKEIERIRAVAEKQLLQRVKLFKRIRNPLLEVISEGEIEAIKKLQAEKGFKVFHLSERQWELFSEIFTYNTNAIEGSELNQREVKQILEKDKWPEDKTKEDISEAYGVREAIKFIRETKEHVSVELIRKIHEIVFKNSKPFAGRFRSKGIEVVVTDGWGNVVHQGAPAEKVADLLKELVKWYNKFKNKYPPMLLACVVHNQFENIHPFEDGNGRVGRILMNNILLKHGLPPVSIDFNKRKKYYAALQEYENNHNVRPTIELLLEEYKALKKRFKVTTKK